MPPVTVFNLRGEDPLSEIEEALRDAIKSMPALEIRDDEVDFVPVLAPDGFPATVTRIYVDPWEGPARTKDALQDLAARMAMAFRSVVGRDRRVKVVIRPYDVEKSGWVSF
jgi:ribosome-binding factor A